MHDRDDRSARCGRRSVDDGMNGEEEHSSLRCALGQAFEYLSYRARSIHEIKEYLLTKGHCEIVVREAIGRLTRYGYLDDLEFARQFVRSKSDWGSKRLRYELRRKRVEASVIDEVMLSPDDERCRCRQLAATYIQRHGPELDWTLKRKLWAYLMRRGFSSDAIELAVRWAGEDMSSD